MASPSVVQDSIHSYKSGIKPNIIPITTFPPQEISQLELTTLLSLRNRAKQVEADIADAERSIKARLEVGGYVEAGEHTAALKENSRRNVSWREVAERLGDKLFGSGKGDQYCERVLRSTKPYPQDLGAIGGFHESRDLRQSEHSKQRAGSSDADPRASGICPTPRLDSCG